MGKSEVRCLPQGDRRGGSNRCSLTGNRSRFLQHRPLTRGKDLLFCLPSTMLEIHCATFKSPQSTETPNPHSKVILSGSPDTTLEIINPTLNVGLFSLHFSTLSTSYTVSVCLSVSQLCSSKLKEFSRDLGVESRKCHSASSKLSLPPLSYRSTAA